MTHIVGKHVLSECTLFSEILDLERFEIAEMTFKVNQGHW